MLQKNELQKFLKKNYSELDKIQKIKKIKHNDINSVNFLINAKKKNYILRFVTDGSSIKKIEKMCEILTFCKKNKIRINEPIKNKKNKYVNNKKCFLTKYYNGKTFSGKDDEIKNLAVHLANLHDVLKKTNIEYNFRPDTRNYKILNKYEIKKIRKILEKKNLNQIDRKIKNNLDYVEEQITKISKKQIKKSLLNKQLIHRDIHPENVIFNRNEVEAIIDFHGMKKSYLISDVAFTCFRFSMYNTKNVIKIQKRLDIFLKMYLKHNKKIKNELKFFKYFFILEMLGKLSMILRCRYFQNSNLWIIDFDKILEYVKIIDRIKNLSTNSE